MTVTLAQLFTQLSSAQARKTAIALTEGVGFVGVSAWQSGTMPRTFGVEVPAALLVDMAANLPNIARGGYNDTAEGAWLTLYSLSAYDNLRFDPVRTQGKCVLTVQPTGLASYPIAVDQLVAVSDTGWTYRNKEAGTLVKGTPLALTFEAETAGVRGNVPVNTIRALQTPLVGVSIDNPGDGANWITRFGADEESDEALRERNVTKWATRSYAAPADAYKYWARQTDPVITRVEVPDPLPVWVGAVVILIAGDDGALPDEVAGRVERYINGTLEPEFGGDGIVRRPMGVQVGCASAAEREIPLQGTVYYAPDYALTVQQEVAAAVQTLERAMPIGGSRSATFSGLWFAALYKAVMSVPGVVNVAFTNPTQSVAMAQNEVAVFLNELQFEVISA